MTTRNSQRGNAQPVVALPCTTEAKLLRQYAKIFVTMATGVGWGKFERCH